jgi:hypothetical protein
LTITVKPLAWGAKVSAEFRDKVRAIAHSIKCEANDLMGILAFESGKSFRADIRNSAGSGAIGLIQFMPQTLAAMGYTTKEAAAMTPERQLDLVHDYFKPWTGKLKTISDLYMAVLWPSGVGKPDTYVLFKKSDPKRPKLYIQNAGLDYNKDGDITKQEAASGPRRMLEAGLLAGNVEAV